MPEIQTIEAPDPGRISGAQRGEFGPQPLDKNTNDELAELEAKITAQASPENPPMPTTLKLEEAHKEQPQPQGVKPPEGTVIPDKFKTQDGNLDAEKVQKSLVNLEHYLSLEKELTQKRQEAQPQPQPQQQWSPQQNVQPQWQVPLEQRVNEDIQKDPGTTIVNLMRAAVMQAEQSSRAEVTELRRRLELMEIGQKDPGVFTKDGLDKLKQTLQENPWLWNSPTPFQSAYRLNGPIQNSPQPATAPARKSAPILPGGPAPGISQGSQITSEADLDQYLRKRFPNQPMQQAEFIERLFLETQK